MLFKVKKLKDFKLHSLDGEIGKVREFYFDDEHWAIRYINVETGNWLKDRQVLISPYSLGHVNREDKFITVNLTKKQIEDSPSIECTELIMPHVEETLTNYYGYPAYWDGSNMWGSNTRIERDSNKWGGTLICKKAIEPNVRSTFEINGLEIQATDGAIGHVEDIIFDDEDWGIRYLCVNTSALRPKEKVLLSTKSIESIDWFQRKVIVKLLRDTVKHSPEYTDQTLLTREYETILNKHYNVIGRWVDDPEAK